MVYASSLNLLLLRSNLSFLSNQQELLVGVSRKDLDDHDPQRMDPVLAAQLVREHHAPRIDPWLLGGVILGEMWTRRH
jgi:hypothetical protein